MADRKFNPKKIQYKNTPSFLYNVILTLVNVPEKRDLIKKINQLFNMYEDPKDQISMLIDFYIIRLISQKIISFRQTDKNEFINYIIPDGDFGQQARNVLADAIDDDCPHDVITNVEAMVNQQLKYAKIFENADELASLSEDIGEGNFTVVDEAIEKYQKKITSLALDFKSVQMTSTQVKKSMLLSNEDHFSEVVDEVIENQARTDRWIKTGIKMLNNAMTGFEKGRLYLILAAAKKFKSGFLLNSAIWSIKHNVYDAVAAQGKKPIVLYVSLENSLRETIERVLSYVKGDEYMNEFSQRCANKEVSSSLYRSEFIKEGIITTSPYKANLAIEYRPSKTVDTEDINKMIDDIELDNYKVVALLVDYIELINPIQKNGKQDGAGYRLELADIGIELSNIGKQRDIPVITAMQLNRSALQQLEAESNFAGKAEAFTKINSGYIGESVRLVQVADMCIVIDKLSDVTASTTGKQITKDYLNIKIDTTRVRLKTPGNRLAIAHPFKPSYGMRLYEDINESIPSSEDLSVVVDRTDNKSGKTASGTTKSPVINLMPRG